jgi:hypothetical protein
MLKGSLVSRQSGSNRRPADYKSAALPTELCRRLLRQGREVTGDSPTAQPEFFSLRTKSMRLRVLTSRPRSCFSAENDPPFGSKFHSSAGTSPAGHKPHESTMIGKVDIQGVRRNE